MPLLFVDISAHGFGHLAQVAPVLEALVQHLPDLELIVRSGLPRDKLASRIGHRFEHIPESSDVAFPMHDAVRVDRDASDAAYRAFHSGWADRVAAEADLLRLRGADLVFSDVSYLPLAGAAAAGVPAVAMSSLNWADQFAFLFGNEPWAVEIHAQIHAAYAGAAAFLRCLPAMPMADLPNVRPIPPVARVGRARRDLLEARLGASGERIVLVAMGGLGMTLPVERWPQVPGLRWLVPDAARSTRADITVYDDLGLHFSDLLASVDALVGKPGYGTFVEAAACGTPLLYLRREDWPEQEALIEWLHAHAACDELAIEDFLSGCFVPQLSLLWGFPRRRIAVDGAQIAAEFLSEKLSAGARNP